MHLICTFNSNLTDMKKLILLFALLLPLSLLAQQQLEDVVYLKDGSIFRGVIIEQIPNESLKIQIIGGSVISVKITDVTKMTKEPPFRPMGPMGHQAPPPPKERVKEERIKVPFEPRLKGYFFQGQLMLEAQQFGIRVVNGYKFGRFGHLGIGVGLDGVAGSPFSPQINGLGRNELQGVFLPLYIYYGGDILKTKITPFYALEAGYAHTGGGPGVHFDDFGGTQLTKGGAMGGLGIGVRFNTRRRINFSLLMNANFKNVTYQQNYYLYDSVNGVYDYYNYTKNATLVMMGLRFGIGF